MFLASESQNSVFQYFSLACASFSQFTGKAQYLTTSTRSNLMNSHDVTGTYVWLQCTPFLCFNPSKFKQALYFFICLVFYISFLLHLSYCRHDNLSFWNLIPFYYEIISIWSGTSLIIASWSSFQSGSHIGLCIFNIHCAWIACCFKSAQRIIFKQHALFMMLVQ